MEIVILINMIDSISGGKKFTKVAFVRLQQGDKILLLQEGGRLAMGTWCFPGGHVDAGESFEQAAIREALEESGYQIKLGPSLYQGIITKEEYKGSRNDTSQVELVIFEGYIIGGELKQDDQALDLRWFDQQEVIGLPLRWSFLQELI